MDTLNNQFTQLCKYLRSINKHYVVEVDSGGWSYVHYTMEGNNHGTKDVHVICSFNELGNHEISTWEKLPINGKLQFNV